MIIPTVERKNFEGSRFADLFSTLLSQRIIFLHDPIDDAVASLVIGQLLFLEGEDDTRPINLYINSPGGHIHSGLAIYDTMQYIKSPIRTICMGMAASMGAFLLAAGSPGQRLSLPHAKIMIHQPSGGAKGQESDVRIQAKEMTETRAILDALLAQHTGQPIERISQDTERDNYMTSSEAMKYGLIDSVVTKIKGISQ